MSTTHGRPRFVRFSLAFVLVLLSLPAIAQRTSTDYTEDPIRQSYKPRIPFPAIDVSTRTQFVKGRITPTAANTSSVIRVKLKDGTRMLIVDGHPVSMTSLTQTEADDDLPRINAVNAEWHAATVQPEERVVDDWRTAEAYWKTQLPDPRSMYFVSATDETLQAVAQSLRELSSLEYLDIATFSEDETPAPISGPPEGTVASAAAAATAVSWLDEFRINQAHTDTGIVGRKVNYAMATIGPLPAGPGSPPVDPWSSYGPFAPSAADVSNFTNAVRAIPKATFGTVHVSKNNTTEEHDFGGGLQALVGRPHPLVYSTDWALVHTSVGISVGMEWDLFTFFTIQTLTGSGKTVVEHAGYSSINLDDRTKYPLAAHLPFIADSGAILVRSPRFGNFGSRVRFNGPAEIGESGAAMSIGVGAALVESAIQQAGQSVPGAAPGGNGPGIRALSLDNVPAAIRTALAARFPNPTLRVQSNAPDYEVLVLNSSKALPEIAQNVTRLEGLRVYNDGNKTLNITAAMQVTTGADNTACTPELSGSSIAPGKGTDLILRVRPGKPGNYVCRLDLFVDDPRTAMPADPARPGFRRWSMNFTFRSPSIPGPEIAVRDLLGNTITAGQTIDFGTLAATTNDDFQVKMIKIYNEPWADRTLTITVPSFPSTARFSLLPATGPISSTYSIEPNDFKTFVLKVTQRYDLGTQNEKLFEEDVAFTTNDSNQSSFRIHGKVRLRNREKLFELMPGPRGYVVQHDDRWASLDLGEVTVDESGLWVLQTWGGFRSLRDGVKAKWTEYTGPVDAIIGLNDKDAKTIGKVLPVDKIVKATEIVDIALQLTVRPPGVGRVRHAMLLEVTPPGTTDPTKTYYIFLTANIKGKGPNKLTLIGPGGTTPLRSPVVQSSGLNAATNATDVIPIGGTLSLGSVQRGASVTKTVTLQNNGTTAMSIRGLWVDGDFFTVDLPHSTIPAGTTIPLGVTLVGTRRGPANAKLSFYVDGTGETDNFFTINLAGNVCEGTNCAASTPIVNSFTATPTAVASGTPATLAWDVTNATAVSISPNVGSVSARGSKAVTVTTTTDFVLTAVNGAESVTRTARLTVIGDGPAGSPVIASFTGTPATIESGQSSTLSWSVTGATTITVTPPGNTVTGSTLTVSPTQNTTYILSATNATGTSTRSFEVKVGAGAGDPVINTFTALPETLGAPGDPAVLTWDVSNATLVQISPGVGTVTASGTRTLNPSVTTEYTLRAKNPAKEITRTARVTVPGTTPGGIRPSITSFTASATSAAPGEPVTLTWEVTGADLVILAPPLQPVASAGSQTVAAQTTTTYTLFARNSAGSVSAEVTVSVGGGPAVPQISEFTAAPDPILIGGGGELRWMTSGATSVTITPDIGKVGTSGPRSIKPYVDTIYVLTATNSAGSVQRATVVKTAPPPPNPLTKPIELLRGTDVESGIRLENDGTTDLYDPLRGYTAGSLPLVVVNRSGAPLTIGEAMISTYHGGEELFSLTSQLKEITLDVDQAVTLVLRWSTPRSPRGYRGSFAVRLKDGTWYSHTFSFGVAEWIQNPAQLIAATDTADQSFPQNYPTKPYDRAPSGGINIGLANDDGVVDGQVKIKNPTGIPVTITQAWCRGKYFSIRPVPPGPLPVTIAANGSANFLITGTNQYLSYGGDECVFLAQKPNAAANEGTFLGFEVDARGSGSAPYPIVYTEHFDYVDDYTRFTNAKPLVLPRLRPNRSATVLFRIKNGRNEGEVSNLHLRSPISVTGSGFRLARGYHASSSSRDPLLVVWGGSSDDVLIKVQFTGKSTPGTYEGIVRIPMWGGLRQTPPFDWEHTYELHIKVEVGSRKIKVSQGDSELDNGGGFDADEATAFTVENVSGATVNLADLAVPPHYVISSGLAHSLAPGQSSTFVVRQAKSVSAEGPHYVSFSVDDVEEPVFQVRENHKPIAVNDNLSVESSDAVSIDVTANDTDPDGDGVGLTALPIITQPAKGTAVVGEDNVIVYAPNPGAIGNDRFTYEIDDGNGGVARAEVVVSLLVENGNPVTNADDVTTKPGRAITIDVTANDTDPDGDPVRLITDPIVVPPTHGTAVKVDGRNILYTPAAGYNGLDTFTYEVGDTYGKRARAIVTIEVANTKPTAVNDVASTKPARAVDITVTANDFDEDGDTVTLIAEPVIDGPGFGTAVKLDAHSIRYTPNTGYAGTDTFTYEIGDGAGMRARATVTITISNTKPVAVADSAATKPGMPVRINVTANDSDADGDPLVLPRYPIVVQPTSGTATRIDDHVIEYTPGASFTGVATFSYEVGDTYGSRGRAQVSVTVSNTKPVAVDDSARTKRNIAVTFDVTANDSDPDGEPIHLVADAIAVQPEHGQAVRVDDHRITYTPNRSFVGTDTLTYEIGDGYSGRDRALVTITVSNTAPPAARNDHATTRRDTPVSINVLANDKDPDGQAITLTASPIKTAPRNGTVQVMSPTTVKYTPNAGWSGNDVFEYEISDASTNKDRAWVAVHVGRTKSLPVAVDDVASTTANTSVLLDVLANDSSPDGDAIALTRYPFLVKPAHGTAARVSDSRISYVPRTDWTGTDTLAYEISDAEGGTAVAFVTISVTSVNRPPVAVDDSASTALGVPVTLNVVANDTDADGDPVSLAPNGIVTAPLHGTAARVSAESIAYTPGAGYSGTDTFEYSISDGHGLTDRGLVTITISAANHPPEAADDDAVTSAGASVTINVTANDSDPDNDHVVLITSPIITPPANGTAVKISGSSITYTPRSGFTGTDRFQYEAGDGQGARTRAWVDVVVGAGTVNHNPVAVDDDATTKESTAVDIDVTANDDDPDGDTVTLIASPVIFAPVHGTATRVSGSTIRYTPATDYVGADTLQYEIGDGRGKRSRAWVRITVRNANSRPVAVNDVGETQPGQAISINVVANDSDPDGDVIHLIAEPIIRPPDHGTVTKVDGNILRYQPASGFEGVDQFRYEIGDGHGGRSRAWVNLTIGSSGAGGAGGTGGGPIAFALSAAQTVVPVAGNDATESLSDTAVPVVVLANDYSVNGKLVRLAVQAVITAPLFGTVERTSDMILTYTPSLDFRGNDRFEYEVIDTDGITTRAWVTVQIPGDNQPPVGVDDIATVPMNGSVEIQPLLNDTDPDSDPLVLTLRAVTVAPQHGVVRRRSDSTLAYAPADNYSGADTFTYELTDARGGTAEAHVVVQVTNGTQPPVARNDSATAESGRAVAINVLVNDADPDGEAIHVVSSEPPQHGSVVWSEDGTATYQSNPNYIGADSFRYTIADAGGLTAQAQVSISVVVTNHPSVVNPDSAETKTRTAVLVGVLVNDYDVDYGQRLTVTAVSTPTHGTAAVQRGESVWYTPANDFAGTDTFTYTVSDGHGTATATVTVKVVNGAPEPHGETLAAPEDTYVGYSSFNIIGNDVDPDGDELHVTLIEQPQHGTFQIAADFTQFSYRASENWYGIDSFYYTVSDPFGEKVRVLAQIRVSAVNDSPVANDDSFTIYKNQELTITQAQVVANDTDIEGHTITVYSAGAATNGTTQKLADGSITYKPYGEFVGTDTFEYVVDDSGGAAYGFGHIRVTVLNDTRPVAAFNVTCTDLVCAFDAGTSTDDRGITTYAWTLGNNSSASGKTFNYTYGAPGSYAVRLTVTDAIGQTSAVQKTVTVTQPNAPPLPRNDAFTTPEDQQTGFTSSQLLANDSDPEGTALTITAVTLPANGTLQYAAGFTTFTFKGNPNWNGVTGFFYTVRDAGGATAQAYVQLTVSSVNDAPVAGNDSFSVYKNQTLSLTAAQVLANDTDVEGHSLSLYSVAAATNGTAQKLADGSIQYQPYGEYVGTDSFDYIVQDSAGGYGTGRITITVLQDNKPVPAFTVTCTGRVCAFDASASTDDRGIVTYQWLLGNGGTAGGKTFNYTYPAAGFFTVRLTIQDTLGQTSILTKTVTVTEPPPDAKDDSFSWKKGYSRYIAYSSMLANDTDPANDALTVESIDTTITDGTVTCDSTGCTFAPPSSYWYGQTTFKYTINDGHGQRDTATVTVIYTY
jgi:hypothetical protein